jgi:hypothetical protein
MPRKGATKKGRRNNQLWVTLPAGARFLLDQLVALKTEGDSHSEIIRAMVIAQLRTLRREYDLKLMAPVAGSEAAVGSESAGQKSGE